MQKDAEMQRTLDALTEVVREMRMTNSVPAGSNIQVNGGGVGVWIATVCCALMLGMGVVGAMVLIDHARRMDDMQHYLAAIYAQAPQLKPAPKE